MATATWPKTLQQAIVYFSNPETAHADFLRLTAEFAAPRLLRDGRWNADYRRIRVVGRKV